MPDDRRGSLDGSAVSRALEGGDSLGRRLGSLPDGHPSSAFDEDGSRREPTVSLRDLELDVAESPADQPRPLTDAEWSDHVRDVRLDTEIEATRLTDQTRPLTDAEWPEHRTDVRSLLATADDSGLHTDHLHTIDKDRKIWTAERNRIQGEVVAELYEQAKDVPCSGEAIIAGGLPGSGKTTILSSQAGIDLSKYLTINPDDIKEEMAGRGLVPHVEGLSPMEASHLAHEEASLIAKRLALRAVADRKNVMWDITMSSRESTEKRIAQLHDAGYTVEGIFVDIPIETSIRRSDSRHRQGHDEYRAGIGLGGRYVPPEVIEAQADSEWGSKNRKAFEDVSHLLQRWRRYDNSVDNRSAALMADSLENDQDPEETAR